MAACWTMKNNSINAQNYNRLLEDLVIVADSISAQILHLKDVYTWDETELAEIHKSVGTYLAFIKVNLDFMTTKGVNDTVFHAEICCSLLEILFIRAFDLWLCLHKLNSECEFDTEDASKNTLLLQAMQFKIAMCQKEIGLNSANLDSSKQKWETLESELEYYKLQKQLVQAEIRLEQTTHVFDLLYSSARMLQTSIKQEREYVQQFCGNVPNDDIYAVLKNMTDGPLEKLCEHIKICANPTVCADIDKSIEQGIKDSQSPNR